MSLHSLISRPAVGFALRDPFALFSRDIDRLLGEALAAPAATSPLSCFGASPKIDVAETEKEISVVAECAGVDQKDIDIAFHEGILTIKGEKKSERDEKKETLHLVERTFGSFSRSIAVPAEIDAEKIKASFTNGILTITLPKQQKETEKARKIEIM